MRIRCLDLLSLQQEFYWRIRSHMVYQSSIVVNKLPQIYWLKIIPILLVLQVRRPVWHVRVFWLMVSQGLKARFWLSQCSSGGSGKEFISKLTQVVGKIRFLAVVEMRSLVPCLLCWLGLLSTPGILPQVFSISHPPSSTSHQQDVKSSDSSLA